MGVFQTLFEDPLDAPSPLVLILIMHLSCLLLLLERDVIPTLSILRTHARFIFLNCSFKQSTFLFQNPCWLVPLCFLDSVQRFHPRLSDSPHWLPHIFSHVSASQTNRTQLAPCIFSLVSRIHAFCLSEAFTTPECPFVAKFNSKLAFPVEISLTFPVIRDHC